MGILGKDYGTKASRALCERVADRSRGTVIIGFSRGKDAIACILQAMEFFHTVIPVHMCIVPGLPLSERGLQYYERRLGLKVLRYVNGAFYHNIYNFAFQCENAEMDAEWMGDIRYDNHDVYDHVRMRMCVPWAWAGNGITQGDSLQRRIYVKNLGGMNRIKRTFFPIFDWPREMILGAVKKAGLSLPEEYKFTNRSVSCNVMGHHIIGMKDKLPEDYARIKLFFPLIDAVAAQREFALMEQKSRADTA